MGLSREYARQTVDNPNLLARFSHRRRHRVSVDLAVRLLPPGGTLVDFGANGGFFLEHVGETRQDVALVGIDPYHEIENDRIVNGDSLDEVETSSVDVLGSFETLEHLFDDDIGAFFESSRRVLKPGGRLIVTVPIMYGLALPVKELSRSILRRRRSDTSLGDIGRGMFGQPIERTPHRRRSHRGFDFRVLRGETATHFDITDEFHLPFRRLPWWMNSQMVIIAVSAHST